MASGLGQKYGAPRRNAQEKLRTEVSRSDTWGMEIQRSLELLRDLCRHKRGQVPNSTSLPAGPVLKQQLVGLKGPKKPAQSADDGDEEEVLSMTLVSWRSIATRVGANAGVVGEDRCEGICVM